MSNFSSSLEAETQENASEPLVNNETQLAQETRIKLERLRQIDRYASEVDLARITTFLPVDQIEIMSEHSFDTTSEKLAVIGQYYTIDQIKAVGPEHFAYGNMTEEKVRLISKFTDDQLNAFCLEDQKAGYLLSQLDVAKLNDLGRLSPETIFVLTHTKAQELVRSAHETPEWEALKNYNIDYPID